MFRRNHPFPWLFLQVVVVLATISCPSTIAQSGNVTRLRQVDQLSGTSSKAASYDQLAKLVLERAYTGDLAALTGLQRELAAAQITFVEAPKTHGCSDADVIAAFDEWRGVIRDPNAELSSPYQLFRFRASLSHFAPSLISKDANGITSDRLSPIEAVYLLDVLIANGGVPKVTTSARPVPLPGKAPTSSSTNGPAYINAVNKYQANTPTSKRGDALAKIVHAYLLK